MTQPLTPTDCKILAREHELEYVYEMAERAHLMTKPERDALYDRSREIVYEIGDLKRELVGLPPLSRFRSPIS